MVETKPSQNTMSVEEVGERFLDYYCNLGYEVIPGSPLLDESVPMSFVMSAGMVQFEKMSGGKRSGDHFALIQNCFRYFDLDLIGDSDTHLSLFQMPAAFDFGLVDRQRTVNQIWKLLTEVYGLAIDSLFVTYFSGGEIDGQTLPPDIETAKAWQAMGLPMEHIIGLGAESNFWSQSSQVVGKAMSRKRGPNTEVFYDRGAEHGCGETCKPGCSCGRFVEFLNTLFITLRFDPQTRQLIPMDEPFTEIVIGRERLALILQQKTSVFEVDSIYPLVQQLRCFSKPLPVVIEDLEPAKFERIFVDHLRALLFLAADGAPPPGRGGRSRLMRILVRELLTSQRLLGISDPGFMRSMILTALELYPQLALAQKRLLGYIAEENERFERTVQVGLYDLEAILQRCNQQISREDVLTLEKKHGLPLPLLRYRLWQKNIAFDHSDYKAARTRSGPKTPQNDSAPASPEKSRNCDDTNEVVRFFLDTYRGLGYEVIPGSFLLDDSIPMSFVMSAGLVQVERAVTPLIRQGNNRFVLLQNCFRHFDLDRIGPSNTHLSFFRMLGAFTFGPVNRLEQIRTAWDLATKTYQLPPGKLWVTYFVGDTIAGKKFEPDLETYQAWRRVGVRESQLLGLNRGENFWKQSAMVVGLEHASKCGPNSEIFFDQGTDLCCGPDCQPGCRCGRFIEFLNMLFITHSLDEESGQIYSLEMPFTESVVGVERLAMILQGVDSIYDIDSIRPLMLQIRRSSEITESLAEDVCLHYERILADHIRALLFLVSDGAPSPGKGGRAFLVRRLVRELLVGMELLGIREPLCLSDLLDQAILLYRDSKPEVSSAKTTLMNYIVDEKLHLDHTLKSGFARMARMFVNRNIQWISGRDILDFEKEYGLPLPLLERFLDENHIAYNPKAIEAAEELWKSDILETRVQSKVAERGMT